MGMRSLELGVGPFAIDLQASELGSPGLAPWLLLGQTSQRLPGQTSQRLPGLTSQRLPGLTSQMLPGLISQSTIKNVARIGPYRAQGRHGAPGGPCRQTEVFKRQTTRHLDQD